MPNTLSVSEALKQEGQSFPFAAEVAVEEMEIFGDRVRIDGVSAEGQYTASGETVSLRGTARGTVHAHCARCLTPVARNVEAELAAEFAHTPDPEDPDQYSYEASTIDLTDPVRDALVLELPIRFLCAEDCRGLCPKCGVNLNTGSCTCRDDGEDTSPFRVLRSIVENNEEV